MLMTAPTTDRRFGRRYVPAGFFAVGFCGFAGAGGGPGARSIEINRPPAKR